MLNILDFIILIGYVLIVITVGCSAAWLQKRKAARLDKAQDDEAYFLAARTLAWPIIGLSLFSTNISTVHIVALCEEGFRSGLAFANFELAAVFTLVILAVFFVPFYLRSHITTLPDFLEKRFNRNCRDFLAFISIISAIFIHIGVSLYAGAVVINAMLGFGTEVAQLMPTMIMIAMATDASVDPCWLEVDLGKAETFDHAVIEEYSNRVKSFELQYKDGDDWKTFYQGGVINNCLTVNFDPVTAQVVRFLINGKGGPSIYEFQLFPQEKPKKK